MPNLFDILNYTGEFAEEGSDKVQEAKIQPRVNTSVPKISDDAEVNAQAMAKMIEISQALAKRFGYEAEAVLKDMFKDLQLINGEQVLAVLDPSNPIDQLTAQMYDDYKTIDALMSFFGLNAKNIMLQKLLQADPEECCDQFQAFLQQNGDRQLPSFARPQRLGRSNHLLEDVDEEFFEIPSGFWTWMLSESLLNEAAQDYDPQEGWTEEDKAFHQSLDWKARNYEDFDAGDKFVGEVYLYDEQGVRKLPDITFHKFFRANPIYPPYYKPVQAPGMAWVGPMYDGRIHKGYEVLDRYESPEVYDTLSEGLITEDKEVGLPADLAQAYKNANAAQEVDSVLNHQLIRQRRRAPFDYGHAHYREISKEKALQILKSRQGAENLRLILLDGGNQPRLVQFVDKGGYGDGKYYRPLYQLYYTEYVKGEDAYTNKNGARVYDSRKMPVTHLVNIASKIYEVTDENPISPEGKAKRNWNKGSTEGRPYPIHVGTNVDYSVSGYVGELDTGSHGNITIGWGSWGELNRVNSDLKRIKNELERAKTKLSSDGLDAAGREAWTAEKARLEKRYQDLSIWRKDLLAACRYSVQASATNIKAKMAKLGEIKNDLRTKRDELHKLKNPNYGSRSPSPYALQLSQLQKLVDQKRDLEAKQELASTGNQDVARQLQQLQQQIDHKAAELADTPNTTISVREIEAQWLRLKDTITAFNMAVANLDQITQQLQVADQNIEECEASIDVSLAEEEAQSIKAQMNLLETQIKQLEELRRELLHKKVDSNAKPVDPQDPEFDLFNKPQEAAEASNESLQDSGALEETYSEEELHDFENKVFNQQKILNIYKRSKYGLPQLFAHTKCTKCGKEKRVLLSNLVNDPDKYGSCRCSRNNQEGRARKIVRLYKGTEKLPTNTSGYTGVYHLTTYNGHPCDKWRAVIEIDGEKQFLGDFDTRKEAVLARKKAAREGVKWYKAHSPFFHE